MRFHSALWTVMGILSIYRPGTSQTQVENAFPDLSFSFVVDIQNAGDGSNRVFAVEQPGRILAWTNDASASTVGTFLDIRQRVLSDDRFGMLGMAFHPDYESNGYFYVHYTAAGPNRSVISRFSVSSSDSNEADENSELILLEVNQPHRFHNGGQLAFGLDGYLYIGFGDGGPFTGAPDPNGEGQNRQTLLGAMLRIEVDHPDGGLNYGIPADNPFAGNADGYREEIWAWGFRNPWRFSFDPETGYLWAGENGENLWEEINIVEKGKNYGWKVMEGSACFTPATGCDTTGLTLPVWEYGGTGQRRSVIGGFVYRGNNNPELFGKYIYGDFLVGQIWAVQYDGSQPAVNTTLVGGFTGIGTFGLDEQGEILMSNLNDGRIYKFSPPPTSIDAQASEIGDFSLKQNYPNPFNPKTTISYRLRKSINVKLSVFDVSGREVKILVETEQPAGNYIVTWDGTDNVANSVASGLYFYRIEAGDFIASRKMLFVK